MTDRDRATLFLEALERAGLKLGRQSREARLDAVADSLRDLMADVNPNTAVAGAKLAREALGLGDPPEDELEKMLKPLAESLFRR